ncbi:MAG: universal stress protein [Phycisphaerales bacterium]|nr:universal stress protein [Phycisphaerales bacterium]
MPGIIACIADSPSAGRVVQGAALCSRAWDMSVEFVHFGDLHPDSRSRLEHVIVEGMGAPATLIEHHPDPREPVSQQVCDLAMGNSADLVVIGALKREGTVRAVVGSTARRVARRCPCSVLLISTEGRAPPQWSRFLVGVERTGEYMRLCERVLCLARQVGPMAEVCFAREFRSLLGGVRSSPEDDLTDLSANERIELGDLIAGLNTENVTTRAVTLPGRPGHEMARYADDARSDLLSVLGPAEPLGVLDRLLSHPLNLLLDQLPCSALIHRAAPASPRRKDTSCRD